MSEEQVKQAKDSADIKYNLTGLRGKPITDGIISQDVLISLLESYLMGSAIIGYTNSAKECFVMTSNVFYELGYQQATKDAQDKLNKLNEKLDANQSPKLADDSQKG